MSAVTKLSKWLVTESGKKVAYGLAVTATIAGFSVSFIPNTFLVDYYLDFIRLYNKGVSVPVSKTLVERFNKAKQYADVPQKRDNLFEPFSVFGFDIYNLGSTYSRFGAYVGLPVNFSYNDAETIDKYKIKIRGESVTWDLPEAKAFLKALVLSENAQIFAMTRELKMLQTPLLYMNSFLISFCIAATYGSSRFINNRLNFYNKPRALRLGLYSLTGTFMAVYYFFVRDMLQNYYERQIDAELKLKDPILKEGGKEFYQQLLERNIALRKLLGKDGSSIYTVLGNENYIVRQPHLPLVQRKEFFDS